MPIFDKLGLLSLQEILLNDFDVIIKYHSINYNFNGYF